MSPLGVLKFQSKMAPQLKLNGVTIDGAASKEKSYEG